MHRQCQMFTIIPYLDAASSSWNGRMGEDLRKNHKLVYSVSYMLPLPLLSHTTCCRIKKDTTNRLTACDSWMCNSTSD